MATKVLFRAEDLAEIQSRLGRRFELIRGQLYEVTVTMRHTETAMQIGRLFMNWNDSARAGRVMGDPGITLERSPDTVRAPDVCFFRKGRLAGVDTRRGYPEVSPDLVVEVRSPNDTWAELRPKAQQFIDHSTELVLIVEPDKLAELIRPGQPPRRLQPNDIFEAPDILPGFRCRVADFFPEEL